MSIYRRGLERLRAGLAAHLGRLAGGDRDRLFEGLEELLLAADTGPETAGALVSEVRQRARGVRAQDELAEILRGAILGKLGPHEGLRLPSTGPGVVVLVGANGSGKTTTAARLAYRFQLEGRGVLLAAADTFRAAGGEQLGDWGARLDVPVVGHRSAGDPAAVVFDALKAAKARGLDRIVVDTAGRVHTRQDLLDELAKVSRVIAREIPGAPHETLLVLDATGGVNALRQADAFHRALKLTGLVLAKLDGSGRGGAVLAIREKLGLPVKLVGVGQGPGDLLDFDPESFTDLLLG